MPAVDDLILNLITTQRRATSQELAIIVAHVAQAPFATYLSRVPKKLHRLLSQHTVTVPIKLPSLEIHLLKRVYGEQQWPIGTTADQYINDLHQAVSQPNVQIWTYRYFGQPFIGFLAPSHVQGAAESETYIFVVYSPVYSTITTGYQASDISRVFTTEHTELIKHQ